MIRTLRRSGIAFAVVLVSACSVLPHQNGSESQTGGSFGGALEASDASALFFGDEK